MELRVTHTPAPPPPRPTKVLHLRLEDDEAQELYDHLNGQGLPAGGTLIKLWYQMWEAGYRQFGSV